MRPPVAWYLQSREWADTPSERRDSAKRCFKHPEQQPQKVNLFRKLVWLRPDDAGVQRETLTQGHVQPPRPAPAYLRPLRPLPSLASWVHKRGLYRFLGRFVSTCQQGACAERGTAPGWVWGQGGAQASALRKGDEDKPHASHTPGFPSGVSAYSDHQRDLERSFHPAPWKIAALAYKAFIRAPGMARLPEPTSSLPGRLLPR